MADRCDDCLDDLPEDRYAVIKRNVLTPEEQEAVDFSTDPFAAALMKYRQAFVCEACSGWYGDDAIPVTVDP